MISVLYCGKVSSNVVNFAMGLRDKNHLDENIEIFTLYKYEELINILSGTKSKYIYCVDGYNGLFSEILANLKALWYLLKSHHAGHSIFQIMPHPLDLFHALLCKLMPKSEIKYFYLRHNPVGFTHVKSAVRNLFISYIDDLNTFRANKVFFYSKNVMSTFVKDSLIVKKSIYIGTGYYKFGKGENFHLKCSRPAILLFFGRILPYKGLDDLLNALKMVRNKVKLIIAGKGLTENQRRLISALSLPIEVYDEWVSDETSDLLYSLADVLILPYRSISQSGPLLTAIGYKLPVIAPDLSGVKEFIVNDVNGLLYSSGDFIDLAGKIDEITSDDRYAKIKLATNVFRDNFEWGLVASRFIEGIKDVRD